ncbi:MULTISPECIES: Txe/YoeB family addiction module toxin [unclassified Synechococcus]|uniref:Txe/YoeB family addiction module toxin n=1 Tax=unclassified Synechococcus TaxID=2626047 RepID=UPI00016DC84A|nr:MULTISPECIES: Txe/YoeB family addiction module toxin [unclassified Synechococcus]ACA98840.1 addiction module toxin, Txe/YoeB family [Picosynechococcus sp. PCC 7002]SMH38175.1 toxin-antitoxin system, toxin component, Txe/YoeB family [Picosynechococcus sp. OG1]SMQ77951.1 toxin-antitoxin system, toxin component, Txe/YoeB family [Synechococcus sp. 7002]
MSWKIILSKQAAKDAKKIASAGLKPKVQKLLGILQENPYQPPYEKLVGDLKDYYSRRINIQHRLVYQVLESERMIKILRMWSHYE